ncbi:retrovirus-related Pol polyprotein from transposon 297 [Trichonephila clavipes]|nr:retrovirus-related Pol polyprotein from transposon 297 [Trichonephila clavipes]
MAFLGKGSKVDLQYMATEMGVEDVLGLKVMELRRAIVNSKNFDEEFCREFLNTIIEEQKRKEIELAERKRKEEMELAERKRLDETEERKRRDEMDFELQKKQIELKEGNEAEVKGPGQIKIDLHKLIPKFDSKFDDISLFLISFERQAKILNLPKICWVTHLISILPSEIVGLIAREPEKDAADYEFVKKTIASTFQIES